MLKIILGAKNEEMGTNRSHCFTDVQEQRHALRVCYAKEQRIVRGYGDGSFKPDQHVTIAEGLKMALGSFEAGIVEGDGHRRYEPFVNFVHDNNLFSKYALFPQGTMTRGQMSYLVHQLVLEKEGELRFTGVRSHRSLGCEQPAPRETPSSVVVHGLQRNFITVLPRGYNEAKDYKLIMAFHGRTNANTMIRNYYRIERAAGNDAIIIYPSGLPEE